MSNVWLMVLAGGAGTRFWPRSRAHLPKQLLPIAGNEPLLNTTIARFSDFIPNDRVLILATKSLEKSVKETVAKFPGVQILAEPEARNTAPCLVMAMEWLRAKDPNATAVIVPADHWITDNPEYISVMKKAVDAAQKKKSLCTVGIQPTRPETGYGYIRSGESAGDAAYHVDRFVEKPSREVAETMVQSPEYLWNAGMFVWTVPAFFNELAVHGKEFDIAFSQYREALKNHKDIDAALSQSYKKAPSISIDYALLEKSKNVMVVPGSSFGWNDLGSFISLQDVYPKTEGGVARANKVVAIDSLANIVDAPNKTVALLGVADMVIVDTGDVLLVATKERAQEVKKLVERLKAEGRTDLI